MGGKPDQLGQNENNDSVDEGVDEGFESGTVEFKGTTLAELQEFTGLKADEAEKDAGGNGNKLAKVEKAKAELGEDESVEEMGASDNEAMEEVEEKRDEKEMGPEKEQEGQEESQESVKNWEEEFEKMVKGENIIESAESRLGGDAKELCEHATDQLAGGERELVGKNFYEWIKHLTPIKKQFVNDIRGRLNSGASVEQAQDESREAAQQRVAKIERGAAGSMANSVTSFMRKLNATPVHMSQVGELWEENRENAQSQFDQSMSQETTAAEDKWFDLMYDKYQAEAENGRTMRTVDATGQPEASEAIDWVAKGVEDPKVFEQELQQLLKDIKTESQGTETGRGIMYELNTLFDHCPEDQKQSVIKRVLEMNSDWEDKGLEIRYDGASFRFMRLDASADEEEMFQLQKQLNEQGVDLSDWINRGKAVNLLRYATDSKGTTRDKLNVEFKGEGGKDITDVDSMLEADGAKKLDMVLKPQGELTVDEVVQCINETSGMPDASANGGEVKLNAKISIAQGKKLFTAMQRKRLIKRNSKG